MIYLVLGTVEFVCQFIEYISFDLSARRQASCIRVRLFKTIIQRVSQSNICTLRVTTHNSLLIL
jgi:hypothetical protein